MVKMTADTRNVVCSVSVQTIVLIPPLNVYTQMRKIVTRTVTQKGMPAASKMASCSTMAARNNLNAAPMTRESRKKNDPDLYAQNPNRLSRYSYIETRLSR